MRTSLRVALAVLIGVIAGCHGGPKSGQANGMTKAGTGLNGHLLIIGGGLDDDNKPVYERFIVLAKKTASDGVPRIVIATAASGNQQPGATGKTESIRAYCPGAKIDVIMRETSSAEGVAIIDQATAMFFTGGDQKRITDKYRPGGKDTPEAAAMRRLLARGGVIAGTSAGDAMMSDPMFYTGRSAEALGIVSTRTSPDQDADPEAPKPNPKAPPVLGPQIGGGMGFMPWAFLDSHFFERHRFGRLVAALEVSKQRLGLGVGEDAGVEVDLSTGDLIGISVADSLLVDVGGLTRDGLNRRGIRAKVIAQGTRVSLPALLASEKPGAAAGPVGKNVPPMAIPTVEAGQNRQLSSWRFFTRAQAPATKPEEMGGWMLKLDGYEQYGWPDASRGKGEWSVVEIRTSGAK